MKEEKLKSKLTDEFLKTLVEAAKAVGWNVDYIVVEDFLIECFRIAGKEKPDTSLED